MTWLLRHLESAYDFPHCLHSWGSWVCVCTCSVWPAEKTEALINGFHSSKSPPVWILMCAWKWEWLMNVFPQSLHSKDFPARLVLSYMIGGVRRKILPHRFNSESFSLVDFFFCGVRKPLWYGLHSKAFCLFWVLTCVLRLKCFLKSFPLCSESESSTPWWVLSCWWRDERWWQRFQTDDKFQPYNAKNMIRTLTTFIA